MIYFELQKLENLLNQSDLPNGWQTYLNAAFAHVSSPVLAIDLGQLKQWVENNAPNATDILDQIQRVFAALVVFQGN